MRVGKMIAAMAAFVCSAVASSAQAAVIFRYHIEAVTFDGQPYSYDLLGIHGGIWMVPERILRPGSMKNCLPSCEAGKMIYHPGGIEAVYNGKFGSLFFQWPEFIEGVYHSLPQGTSKGTVTMQRFATVPEPSTWALMILGMGAVGAALRTRRSFQPA